MICFETFSLISDLFREVFHFYRTPRSAVTFTQPPVQRVPKFFTWSVYLTTRLHLMLRLRICGAVPLGYPLLCTFMAWPGIAYQPHGRPDLTASVELHLSSSFWNAVPRSLQYARLCMLLLWSRIVYGQNGKWIAMGCSNVWKSSELI